MRAICFDRNGGPDVLEARVAAAMRRLAKGRTTIVIAHRLATAQAADRIVVLDGGAVAEVGSHDELLARGGRYASMWEAFEHLGRDERRSAPGALAARG